MKNEVTWEKQVRKDGKLVTVKLYKNSWQINSTGNVKGNDTTISYQLVKHGRIGGTRLA